MKEMEITTKVPALSREHTATVSCMGETLAEDVEFASEAVVKQMYDKSVVLAVQALVRRLIKAGQDDAAIAKAVSEYRPGLSSRIPGATKKTKILNAFASMTAEEKKAVLAELRAMKNAEAAQEKPAAG